MNNCTFAPLRMDSQTYPPPPQTHTPIFCNTVPYLLLKKKYSIYDTNKRATSSVILLKRNTAFRILINITEKKYIYENNTREIQLNFVVSLHDTITRK